jgi:putative membrane-bound dehydrogenase-like protein
MSLKMKSLFGILISLSIGSFSCNSNSEETNAHTRSIDDISANEDVARYLKNFKGLGALTDSSAPIAPEQSMSHFRFPGDLAMDIVLTEPEVVQPVELSFDQRGRLWVVQYTQYPFPNDLKVVSVDNFLRFKYDRVPLPPPQGVKGADKITIFEDTDGDGKYDKSTDAITGLNIATSVVTGRGKIWVLNPPYLLSYPDRDGDGIPDGSPEVELTGFGMEDLHAVANSLRWGPDGWLYGAQGSTTTANISSSVTKNVSFSGQVIWRYNTDTHVFEVFAEGGGNTFNVEFDSKGRVYSGNNAYDRGPNFKQGGYYPRSLGKHGAYTNPFTFGNLPNMELQGDKSRFTHSLIRYEGGKLPDRYEGKMIAVNPLLHYVQLTRFEPDGSTFKNVDEERILETDDRWFRPVNIKAGPDGNVYIADWYDSRLSNTDPRDTWSKNTGRIYRLRDKSASIAPSQFDLTKYSTAQLIESLKSDNKWFRQHALRQFADKKDPSVIPALMPLLQSGNGQHALEALWAIHVSGGFNDSIAGIAFTHPDPYVRVWGVRLSGDAKSVSKEISEELIKQASNETHPEVRSQLACTAKRLPAADAIAVIRSLLKSHDDIKDPDIPLLMWWAVESKAETDRNAVLELFKDRDIWKSKIVQDVILKRLMQRYVIAGGDENFSAAAMLIKLSPEARLSKLLASALYEGLHGADLSGLSPELTRVIQPYQSELLGGPLALAIRQGDRHAISKAIAVIADDNAANDHRLSYIKIMGETDQPGSVPALLKVVSGSRSSSALRDAALYALQRYDSAGIGLQVVKAYPGFRGDAAARNSAIDLLVSRATWTKELLKAIDESKTISTADLPDEAARRMKLLNDPEIEKNVYKLWPNIKPVSLSEKDQSMAKYSQALRSGSGDADKGRVLYLTHCGRCHRLFDMGGNIGPDLTGYERSNTNYLLQNIIDPNTFIREGYGVYQVTTSDGRTLEGKIVSRNGNALTFEPPLGGRKITLLTSQIKEMKEEQASVMPERLLDGLTDQEVRDLFSYLRKENP